MSTVQQISPAAFCRNLASTFRKTCLQGVGELSHLEPGDILEQTRILTRRVSLFTLDAHDMSKVFSSTVGNLAKASGLRFTAPWNLRSLSTENRRRESRTRFELNCFKNELVLST